MRLVGPAIANLYRALGNETSFVSGSAVLLNDVAKSLATEVNTLNARVKQLEQALDDAGKAVCDAEVEMARSQANEERWRRDAVEDRPAREVLKEVREVLGVREGEGVVDAAKRLVETLAEFKDVHVNIRPWIARAQKLMSTK